MVWAHLFICSEWSFIDQLHPARLEAGGVHDSSWGSGHACWAQRGGVACFNGPPVHMRYWPGDDLPECAGLSDEKTGSVCCDSWEAGCLGFVTCVCLSFCLSLCISLFISVYIYTSPFIGVCQICFSMPVSVCIYLFSNLTGHVTPIVLNHRKIVWYLPQALSKLIFYISNVWLWPAILIIKDAI